MINTKTETNVWVIRIVRVLGLLPELPKLISGNQNCYLNLGLCISGSCNSGPSPGNLGTGNRYWVICPDLLMMVTTLYPFSFLYLLRKLTTVTMAARPSGSRVVIFGSVCNSNSYSGPSAC